jgi:glycosyltransferase involved in cell wall biosynthesis
MFKKVLFLTKYSNNGASSRIRTFQYLYYLKTEISERNYTLKVSPFFSKKYLELLYSNKNILYEIILAYVKRFFFLLFFVDKYDVVIIEKEIFPKLPKLFYKIFIHKKIPYLVDFDDATFDAVNSSILLNKYKYFLSSASMIVCGNEYLKTRVQEFGGKNITILPSVINEKKYCLKESINLTNIVTIGWIGTPHTIKYLEAIISVLDELSQSHKIKLITIGGKLDSNIVNNTSIDYEYVNWNIETEVSEISKFDIGIMPLDTTNWEKGKCAYKLIQYMALAVPVVATRISANIDLLGSSEDYGLLADDRLSWKNKLALLIENPSTRKKFGALGRMRIISNYSLSSQSSRYLNLIDELISYSSK